jgi:hypothetical protein
MHASMFVGVYVYMYNACVCGDVCIYIYIRIYACFLIYLFINIYMCICGCTDVWMEEWTGGYKDTYT